MRFWLALALAIPSLQGAAQPDRVRNGEWRSEIMHALHVPAVRPALDTHVWSTFSPMRGVLADRVTYSTAEGMLVPAVVYRPDPTVAHFTGKLPGIVVVNGHGGDKFSWYAFYSGLEFARAGAVVLTYDPIGEGERNSGRLSRPSPTPHDVYPPTPAGFTDDAWRMAWGRHVAGLMQADLQQAVSYLSDDPLVDRHRIAVLGYSMGSFVAGIEGAYDRRVHAVVLSGGGVFDGPGEYYDSGKLPCQMPPYRALSALSAGGRPGEDRGAILFALNADRGPMLIQNGSDDTVMDIPHHGADWFNAVRQRALALVQSDSWAANNVFTTVFYPGVSHRTSWVNADGVRWLNQQLHFAFWDTDEKIAAAGTTHISSWITANHIDISKNYLREDREGGLDAVGTGFPGFARADLMVLPEADWQRLKNRLTWEGWRDRMLPVAAREATATPQ